jgi:hypothetical protein
MTINYTVSTLPSQPDQRDIPFVPKRTSGFPASVDLMPNVEEVEDQGSYGTCVANGVGSACEWLANKHGQSIDLSRMFVYNVGRAISGFTKDSPEGMIPRDALKAAYRYGIPSEVDFDYTEAFKDVIPSDEMFKAAAEAKVKRYEAVYVNWLHQGLDRHDRIMRVKAALDEGMPVMFALMVTTSLFGLKGAWRLHDYKGLNSTFSTAGGHYMVIVGYDDSAGKFLVQNSWGKEWGDGGFCGLPYWIVDEMFFEAWVIRDFDGYNVPETPGIKMELLNRFLCQARLVPEQHETGKEANIWVGAKLPDGRVFVKAGDTGDVFVPIETGLTPCYRVLLKEEVGFSVVNWLNLEPYTGAELYAAYGSTPLDWKLYKLGTVPRF